MGQNGMLTMNPKIKKCNAFNQSMIVVCLFCV